MRANAVRRSSDTVSTRSVAVVPCGARVSSKKKSRRVRYMARRLGRGFCEGADRVLRAHASSTFPTASRCYG